MRNDTRNINRSTALASLLMVFAASSAIAQEDEVGYAIVSSEGVTVRNVRDADGIPIGKFGPGTVLALHKTMGQWSQVEPAGGLTCWVLGEFLNKTGVSGRYEVNANGVNMRPLASSEKESFPLMDRLFVGDTVRMVSRKDPSVDFSADWIQIRTPQGVRGWALTSAIELAPVPELAAAIWEADWKEVMDAMGGSTTTPEPVDAATPTTGAEGAAAGGEDDLVRARRMMNSSPPQYDEAKALYAEVLARVDPSSPLGEAAKRGMMEADAYESIEALQRKLEMERSNRERENAERAIELELRRAGKTPLMGKYDARGWLEPRNVGGETVWCLRFSGKDSCYVQCTSGRYDLGMFEGYEIGVVGSVVNEPGAAQATCDMRSIEVIAGRSRK